MAFLIAVFASGRSKENPKSSFGMDFNGTRFGFFDSADDDGSVAQVRIQVHLP